MNFSFLPKLKERLGKLISHHSQSATINSPEAALVSRAEAVQTKLARVESMPTEEAKVKAVADAVALIGSARPTNFCHAVEDLQATAEAVKALSASTTPAAAEPADEVTDLLHQITEASSLKPKNLDDARQSLMTARHGAQRLLQMQLVPAGKEGACKITGPSAPATSLPSSSADEKLKRVEAMFTEAGLNFNQAFVSNTDNRYLARALARARSSTSTAPATAALSPLDSVPVPPTDEEILRKYEQLSAAAKVHDREAVERRAKFYGENEGAIRRALSNRRADERQQRFVERAQQQLAPAKSQAAAEAAAKQELRDSDAAIMLRYQSMASGPDRQKFYAENTDALWREFARRNPR